MGTERMQPLTLICNYPEGRLYTLQADLTGLKILDVEVGLDWALLIAFNRGKLESVKGSRIYQQYGSIATGCDMVIGYIANDRMFVVLDRFFNGNHGFGSDQQSIRLETGKTVCGSDRTGVRPNQNLGRATYLRGRP